MSIFLYVVDFCVITMCYGVFKKLLCVYKQFTNPEILPIDVKIGMIILFSKVHYIITTGISANLIFLLNVNYYFFSVNFCWKWFYANIPGYYES